MATFILTLYLPISDTMVPRVLSPMTISAYDFSFSYLFLLPLWCTQPSPHLQHTPLLREVPSIVYLCASTQWLCHGTSQIDILAKLSWRNIQSCVLFYSMRSECYYCQPGISQKIPYIDVPWVNSARFIPILLHFHWTLVILEWNFLFDFISLGLNK